MSILIWIGLVLLALVIFPVYLSVCTYMFFRYKMIAEREIIEENVKKLIEKSWFKKGGSSEQN